MALRTRTSPSGSTVAFMTRLMVWLAGRSSTVIESELRSRSMTGGCWSAKKMSISRFSRAMAAAVSSLMIRNTTESTAGAPPK